MNSSKFSLWKLHKFQKQKQRMAELETARCKLELDESVQRLQNLCEQFDQAARISESDLAQSGWLASGHRDLLEHLQREIDSARDCVVTNTAQWKRKLAEGTREKIRAESYETLNREEQLAQENANRKSELIQLTEIIMRQWARPEGE